MLKKILYATDLSEKSLAIINMLPDFKCLGVEEVVVLRVINLTRVLGVAKGIDVDAYIKAIEEESLPKLAEIGEEISKIGYSVKVIPPPAGDPVGEIVRFAKEEKVDMILMGSRGRSTIKAILLGSTAEGVVRRANLPVMVCKNKVSKPFSRILYAYDFTAENVGRYVKFIAKSCNSKVIVAHVLEKGEIIEEDRLDQIEMEFENIDVKIVIGEGNPPKEIVKMAEVENANSIFVGRGKRGILGSTADHVIRYSKVPVFVA